MAEIRKDLFIRDLGDGLVLRHGCVEDAEPLAAFNADVHRDDGATEPSATIAAWTRDLSSRPHPSFTPADFTIVEDTRTGAIVSSLNLISQTWSYGGIDLPAGRPELVGTAPDYRRRGLVRAQFDVVHRWSAARGELMQGITGIPYYYRQFGYEMAVDLGGGRVAYAPHVPDAQAGRGEPLPRPPRHRGRPALHRRCLRAGAAAATASPACATWRRGATSWRPVAAKRTSTAPSCA